MKDNDCRAIEAQNAQALRDYMLTHLDVNMLLIMFSVLPKAEIARMEDPALLNLRRNMWRVFANPKRYKAILQSPSFVLSTVNAYTRLYWQAFHAGGRQYAFSQFDSIRLLAMISPFTEQPFPALKVLYDCCPYLQKKDSPEAALAFRERANRLQPALLRFAATLIEQQNWQPIIACIRHNRCAEDYVALPSTERSDFFRDWYHKRAKAKVIPLPADYGAEPSRNELQGRSTSPAPGVWSIREAEDALLVKDFLQTLDERDTKILRMRMYDYTYAEIALAIGFQTHSAVVKRMAAIRKIYVAYCEERRMQDQAALARTSTVQRDTFCIFAKAACLHPKKEEHGTIRNPTLREAEGRTGTLSRSTPRTAQEAV